MGFFFLNYPSFLFFSHILVMINYFLSSSNTININNKTLNYIKYFLITLQRALFNTLDSIASVTMQLKSIVTFRRWKGCDVSFFLSLVID